MLHKGKTFRSRGSTDYATIRSTASGRREICIVVDGITYRPATDGRGNLVFPQSVPIPRNLKVQARRALRYKIRLDMDRLAVLKFVHYVQFVQNKYLPRIAISRQVRS